MALSTAPLRSGLLLRRARFSFAAVQRALRDTELVQILICGLLGLFVGAVVDILREGVFLLHRADFGIPGDHFLSEGVGLSRVRLLVVPLLGGLLLGLCARAVKTRISDIVDPIEANALHGGRMSLKDSLWLTFTTLLSNAAGASLGMEAGYSQLGAGLYSAMGRWFRLRRADQRIFVTAGAAAAIAAAFNAPLAGAFYGYELILGSYTARALAPVIVASVCAALTQRSMSHMKALFDVGGGFTVTAGSYLLFAVMGVAAAGVAVAAMQAVTWIERGLRHTKLPDWLRPALGGAALTLLALIAPQVLGSGHGAVQVIFDTNPGITALLLLLTLKLLASALSVGAGFRGGLFSSALFLGTLLGAAFAAILFHFAPGLAPQRPIFLLAGMGAVAGAIIGGPLTLVFLVLEGTGDFQATVAVVIAVTVAASLVRIFFGFSFATWRFHLKGLSIRGGHDVGWTREMNAGKLMRTDAKTVPANLGLRALRAAFPPGAAKRLFVLDGEGQYAGLIDIDDLHDVEIDDALDGAVAGDLAMGAENYLLPSDDVRGLLARFDTLQSEALPVLASTAQRRVVGYVTEAYALKRYSQELERMRSAELGQQDLFSIGPKP